MGVTFKGGTSGNREDGKATTSGPADNPVTDTSTTGSVPSTIHLQAQVYAKQHADFATPDFMPTGATDGSGTTDAEDPGATTGSWGPGVKTSNAP